MNLLHISLASLLNRKTTAILTIISVAISVCLLLGIERVRSGAKKSFESTVSGVDLIVGSRTGPLNLMLYSVFRIGNATNNISYNSYSKLSQHPEIQWTIPISLGDSHKSFKVVGTNQDYFTHFTYAGNKALSFKEGKKFENLFDVVVGHDVAQILKYSVGDKITLSHGSSDFSFQDHSDKPFTIVGILRKTSTPVDKSVHVSLEAIEAIHIDWKEGMPPTPGQETDAQTLDQSSIHPQSITAFFVKLKSRIAVFNVQRAINKTADEPLMAILPGVTLRDMWSTIGTAETVLLLVSLMVFLVTLVGLIISILSTLNERRREMAILRSLGASQKTVFSLLLLETSLLSLSGIFLGIGVLYLVLFVFQPFLEGTAGLTVGLFSPTSFDIFYLGSIFLGSLLASLLPAWQAYRNSLADGLTVKY